MPSGVFPPRRREHTDLLHAQPRGAGPVTTGAYAYVRHPLYSGKLMALLSEVIGCASVAGLCAWAVFAAFMWYVARYEEDLLKARFGREYWDYAGRVPMLIPLPRQPLR